MRMRKMRMRFFIRVEYFNHAANLLKYFDKIGLLKKKENK